MPLKEVGGLATRVGVSLLANSPFWGQQVEEIELIKVYAFMRRMISAGKRDQAETALDIALTEVMMAVEREEIPAPVLLYYQWANRIQLTPDEFREGLFHLGNSKAAAVLFALETGIDATEVAQLKHENMDEFMQTHPLSDTARRCTWVSLPRHVRLRHVFWCKEDGLACPLFSLEADVFDAFGLAWDELAAGYADILFADDDPNRDGPRERFI